MNRLLRSLLPLLLIAFLSACRSSDPEPPLVLPPSTSGVYVLNEGTFSGGGGISFVDAATDSVFADAVVGASDWAFPNDMKVIGNKGYVAVNGSNRVDVVDLTTRHVIKGIVFPPGRGPGFLAWEGDSMAVANYDGSVCLIDLRGDSIVGTVEHVVGFPGGVAMTHGKVFVSDIGLYPTTGDAISVLRLNGPVGRDTIQVENAPGAMVELSGALYVVASGTGRVYKIDPLGGVVADSLQLSGYLSDIATDGEYLYVMNSDSVAKVEDAPLSIISTGQIRRTSGSYFYAMNVSRPSGMVFVTNVMSSGGSGRLEAYRPDGTAAHAPWAMGLFPGTVAFRP